MIKSVNKNKLFSSLVTLIPLFTVSFVSFIFPVDDIYRFESFISMLVQITLLLMLLNALYGFFLWIRNRSKYRFSLFHVVIISLLVLMLPLYQPACCMSSVSVNFIPAGLQILLESPLDIVYMPSVSTVMSFVIVIILVYFGTFSTERLLNSRNKKTNPKRG